MKKILYFIFALSACVLPLTSCSDMLEEESRTEIDKNKYMNNAAEAEIVLLGVYRDMVSDAMYGYNLSLLFNITTDIAQCEGNNANSFREIPANAFTTSNSSVQSTWSKLYNLIYNANDFIETLESKVDNFSDKDKQLANIYIAEARGLRGMYYFELVRWYGHVALMTNTQMSSQHPSTFVQATPENVYKFIEDDLLFASENLPYATEDTYRDDNSFRMSKGTALGLLTKVYATWAGKPIEDKSQWEKAALTAQTLIESGKHSLLPDYEQLWKNTCNGVWDPAESLMEVSFYAPTVTGSGSEDPVGRIGKWNGVKATDIAGVRGRNAANVKVVHTFFLDWKAGEPEDLRRNLSIANYQYDASGKIPWAKNDPNDEDPEKDQKNKQNYTPAKWDTEKYVSQGNQLINNDRSNINWYILRYADVLLLYAEALNEWKQAPTAEAYNAVNMVRRRGYGLPISEPSTAADLPEGLGYNAFKEAVHKERAYELAFEGHRRQDLVRWGEYYSAIKSTAQALVNWYSDANYVARQYTREGKHELFPIPQRDMDLMIQFRQNPGWN